MDTDSFSAGCTGKPKIGYVLKRFPNLSQTFILNEILELERQGLHIEIISLRPPREEPRHQALQKLKARVTYLSVDEAPSKTATAEAIAAWSIDNGLQHLHAHFATSAAESAMQAAKLCNIGYSFTAHARDIYHQKVDKSALAERIAHAAFVVTVSDYNRNNLNNLLSSFNYQGHVRRLYNGLDLDLFKPSLRPAKPGLIVSIGRLVPKKGLRYLIDACLELKKHQVCFNAVIIGDGEEHAMLSNLIQSHGLQNVITLAGALAQGEVLNILSSAELFVLPCTIGDDGDIDGLPTVILEAMALGIPVVSTRLAGIPEMIKDKVNGLLVEQKQTLELAEAIQSLLVSSELRNEYREQSLFKMAADFDLRKNASHLSRWFSDACTPVLEQC